MQVYLDYIKFKNFLSYGNQLTEIKFEKGMSLIHGLNGEGKSSCVLDTLCYNWFGKPYRKVNLEDLINWHNGRELLTESGFHVGNDYYKVIRGMKPSIFKIIKNDIEMEMLSTKDLSQEELENILGINLPMFKQTVSLAVSYNQPFLKMKLDEKREILENVFNVRVFGKMLSSLKKKISVYKVDYEINKKMVATLEENILFMKKNIQELKVAKSTFETNRDNKIRSNEDSIKEYETLIINLNKEVEENTKKIEALNVAKRNIENIIEKTIKIIDEFEKSISNTDDPQEVKDLLIQKSDIEKQITDAKNEKIPETTTEIEQLKKEILLWEIQKSVIHNKSVDCDDAYKQLLINLTTIQNIIIDEDKEVIDNKIKYDSKLKEYNKKNETYNNSKNVYDYNKITADSKVKMLLTNKMEVQCDLGGIDAKIQQVDKDIKFFTSTSDICPITKQQCNTITVDFKACKIKELNENKNNLLQEKESISIDIQKYNNEIIEVNGKIEQEKIDLDNEKKTIDTIYATLSELSTNLSLSKKAAENNKNQKMLIATSKIESYKKEFENNKDNEKLKINSKIVQIESDMAILLKDLNKDFDNKISILNGNLQNIDLRITAARNNIKQQNDNKLREYENDLNNNKNSKMEIDSNLNRYNFDIKSANDRIGIYKKDIVILNKNNEELKNSEFNINIDEQLRIFNEKIIEYQKTYKDGKDLSEKIRIGDVVSSILGDKGIKSYFFSKLLPILNLKVNQYISKFDLPVKLMFDETITETITVVGCSEPKNYYSLSEGQKKIIDISILLSFIDIARLVCNWNSNMLIIDELVDGQLDDNKLGKVLEAIKEMAIDNSIYIISHRLTGDWLGAFDRTIEAKQENGYSKLIFN